MSEDDNNAGSSDADNSGNESQQHDQNNNLRGDSNGDTGRSSFQAITTQEALDALVRDRVRRAEQKGFKSAEERYKPGHDRAEALDNELSSEAEKQAKAAREEERGKVRSEFAPRLVKQAFRAEAKGVLEPDQLTALLEDLDLNRYVTDDGDVDEDKVAKKIAAIAPKQKEREFPDLGAGKRGGTAKNNSMSAFIRERAGITGG